MNRILLFLLATWLVACGGPSLGPQTPTFTLRLEPPVLNLRVTETASLKVIVTRSGGFAEAVSVSLGGESAGLEAAPQTITGSEGSLSIRVTDAATIGTSAPVVTGKSASVTRTETLTLHVAKAIAVVTGVIVQGGGAQARQGAGVVVLVLTGSNLERVGSVNLGDLETTLRPGRTATMLEVQASVVHGASLGAKDLVLSSEGGDTTMPAVLTVTAITAAPTGNDASGAGTPDKPYRSLKKALSVSQSGDTVRLLNGTYNAANGETWPDVSGGNPVPNVPAGVLVEGEGVATVLEGPGSDSATIGLAFAGDGRAKDMTAKGFGVGFEVTSGTVILENTLGQANSAGLRTSGGTTKLIASEIKASTVSGVLAAGTATLEVTGGSSHDNSGYGYFMLNSSKLKATNLDAYKNSVGIGLSGQAEASLEQSKLHDNRAEGLAANTPTLTTVSVSGCDLYANASGLAFGGKSLFMRGTTIRDNIQSGLVVNGLPERVDLGTFTEPGNNDLHDNSINATTPQVLDARLYPVKLDHVVFTASATKLNGTFPKPDIYVGQFSNPPYFSISSLNTTIQFF
jgi:hypothetical protein